MLYLYTFCCDIGKHSKSDLTRILDLLMNSIHKHIPRYKLLCFTNFRYPLSKVISKKYNIEYRDYYDKQKIKLYNDKWLNLSFNKINIYKDLYDECKIDFCWIDLDTVICQDISYVNDLSNIFIEIGGTCLKKNILFSNNSSITVPRNRYIQGNFWKLNISLYNTLLKTLYNINEKKLKLRFDLQDLFNYYIYIESDKHYKNVNILGNNIKTNTINGLAIWSEFGNTHATQSGLNDLYLDNYKLKSKLYPNKDIHILSFTFDTIKKLYHLKNFKQLFMC